MLVLIIVTFLSGATLGYLGGKNFSTDCKIEEEFSYPPSIYDEDDDKPGVYE